MGDSWINCFAESLKELEHESNVKGSTAWTLFLTKVMHSIGEKMDCYVQSKNAMRDVNSGEFLNIDALFFRKEDCKAWTSVYAPSVKPFAAIELENGYTKEKIAYCLWKVICIRCEIRALICHQANAQKRSLLKGYLEKMLNDNNLIPVEKSNLYVIISDDSSRSSGWNDYYSAFEWRVGGLEKIKIF